MSSLKKKRQYWRSLGELDGSKEFTKFLDREFQEEASELTDPISRRTFIKMMGASMALAGVTGCSSFRKPKQIIKPYAQAPEKFTPGKATFYATSYGVNEDVVGLLAESHEGRPTKLEGNPTHPSSQGATKALHQASVLDLYDPDRQQHYVQDKQQVDKKGFLKFLSEIRANAKKNQGKRLAVLTEHIASPTYHRLLSELKRQFPSVSIHQYNPANRDSIYEGTQLVTGQALNPVPDFEKATIILSLGADFLGDEPGSIEFTKGFSRRRDPEHADGMNRLYSIESGFSITGAQADHRFRIPAHQQENALWLIADALLKKLPSSFGFLPARARIAIQNGARRSSNMSETFDRAVIEAISSDLIRNRTRSLIMAGPHLPASVHGLVYLLNEGLRNNRSLIRYYRRPVGDSPAVAQSNIDSLNSLTTKLSRGGIDTLIIIGGNPVYSAPGDVPFKKVLSKAANTVHLTSLKNDTSSESNWIIPRSHYLESWGDLQSINGTTGIVQPLIQPLYDSLNEIEVLARLVGSTAGANTLVKQTYNTSNGSLNWQNWLHNGVISKGKNTSYKLVDNGFTRSIESQSKTKPSKEFGIEVVFHSDPSVNDGRFINNAWLQELPDPITKLTWDNAAMISPFTATKLGIKTEDVITISSESGSINTVAMVLPGQADDSVSLYMGYGQYTSGRLAEGSGYNIFPLQSSDSPYIQTNVKIQKSGEKYALASTQNHWAMRDKPEQEMKQAEKRQLVREQDVSDFERHPEWASHAVHMPKNVTSP